MVTCSCSGCFLEESYIPAALSHRPVVLDFLHSSPGALNSPFLGAEPKRWEKDVYKPLEGKSGGRAERTPASR